VEIWISMLEHYAYCPRQCALIHLEQTYDENVYTIRGRLLHERVDQRQSAIERGIRIERGLPLWSERLGIRGIADVVEFHGGIPYPVEYKSGKRMKQIYRTAADIQLCAQGLCLEEMLAVRVEKGAVFHKGSHRRREVLFTDELRLQTMDTIEQVRVMMTQNKIPAPVNDKRCPNCSLIDSCLPVTIDRERIDHISDNLFHCEE
jgi:CRISPR-associated exonuclease Cas4